LQCFIVTTSILFNQLINKVFYLGLVFSTNKIQKTLNYCLSISGCNEIPEKNFFIYSHIDILDLFPFITFCLWHWVLHSHCKDHMTCFTWERRTCGGTGVCAFLLDLWAWALLGSRPWFLMVPALFSEADSRIVEIHFIPQSSLIKYLNHSNTCTIIG
jgi:hypothetical protein